MVLNGSCSNVCPVKINIHEQIYAWRRVLVQEHEAPLAKKAAMKAASELLSRPAAYRAAILCPHRFSLHSKTVCSARGVRALSVLSIARTAGNPTH